MSLALISISMDALWRNALAIVPLALAVGLLCRCLPCRPATRHALWLIVLLSLLAPPLIPQLDFTNIAASRLSTPAPVDHPPITPAPAKLRSPASPSSLSPTVQANSRPSSPRPRSTGQPEKAAPTWATIAPNHHAMLSTIPKLQIDPILERPEDMVTQPSHPAAQAPSNMTDHVSPPVLQGLESEATGALVPAKASGLRQWTSQMLAIGRTLRDAIAALPPVPASLWLGGSALVILLVAARIVRFRRLLRTAVPAPHSVRELAAQAASIIGVKSPPKVLMAPQRISPLLWCGRRRLLLLPQDLWEELDNIGRSAILLHELAHLRRRDHWVCWAQLIVGCLYWWHPLVWWIRRRLRDEADFCCDAWVTALLPGCRIAYARALLATRQYINDSQHAVPAVGLAVTSTRAKRFARRLTMVMTQRSRPRLSMLGGACALCLAVGAWLSTPLWACPPEEQSAQAARELKAAKTPKPPKAPKAPKAPRAPRAVIVQPGTPAPDDVTTFEEHMAGRERPGAPGGDDVRHRLDRLEERLNRLSEQLDALMQGGGRGGMGGGGGGQRRSPLTLMVPQGEDPALTAPYLAAVEGLRAANAPFGFAPADDGPVIVRIYRLPTGKRDSFYQFMSRSDVPILVGVADEGIEVHATPRQHEIVAAFIAIVNPSEDGQEIEGGARQGEWRAREEMVRAYERAAQAAVGRIKPVQMQEEVRAKIEAAMKHHADKHHTMHEHIRKLHEKAEQLRQKAGELRHKSSEKHSQAAELEDEAAREEMIAVAEALSVEADSFDEQADSQQEQIDDLQAEIDELQAELEELIAEAEEAAAEADAEEAEAAAEAAEAEAEADAEDAALGATSEKSGCVEAHSKKSGCDG